MIVMARREWSKQEIKTLYEGPLLELIYRAATVHREFHDPQKVQKCSLLSIKTGGCSEDCSYCPQSARYKTPVESSDLLSLPSVLEAATLAQLQGSTRFCMGAAWREVKDGESFDRVLEMVQQVAALGLEVCCTLGMVNQEQATRLKAAGLTAYNHNLDTGEDYYAQVITTRTYRERLDTLANVRQAGITVCCGGIIGLGESVNDRIELLHTLASLPNPPESIPINALVPVAGTPLESQPLEPVWDMLRMIATSRIVMPQSMVRLSAGRLRMSQAEQALCFLAGANSIFVGDKLLTTANPKDAEDQTLFDLLGLYGAKSEKVVGGDFTLAQLCQPVPHI